MLTVQTFLSSSHLLYYLVFGLLYYFDASQDQVKKMKQDHPTLVMMATFLVGYFFIYQVHILLEIWANVGHKYGYWAYF